MSNDPRAGWFGHQGDGGGLDPLFSGQAQVAKVDCMLAEQEGRERAQARAQARAKQREAFDRHGVGRGKLEPAKAPEPAATSGPLAEPPENSVTGNCPAPGVAANFDAQGSLIVQADRALQGILAGLLYDFAAFLTTRPPVTIGDTESPAPVIDALVEFAKHRCLSLDEANVERWREAAAALALPQVQAGPGTLQREAASHAHASPLTTVAGLPDGRGRR